jgi:hypothetical protein
LQWVLGATWVLVIVLSIQSALGLVFDARYRDIPFAPLSGAIVPYLLLSFFNAGPRGPRPVMERTASALLALSALFVAFNETFANWQAVWFSAGLLALAITLLRVRDAPG